MMPSQNNNTLALHATLAHEIKSAKKTMFKRHREGLPLRAAVDQFVVDVTQRFKKEAVQISAHPTAHASNLLPVGNNVPVVSVADNCGRKQFEGVVDEAKLDERDRVQSEVITLLNFFESRTPDFVSNAVVDAIDQACIHFGIGEPTYNDDDPKYGTAQTSAILTQLFARTKLFSMDDIKPDPVADLSWAISHICHSPIAPERLRREVTDFVMDTSGRLLDESPEMVEKALGFGMCGYGSCPGSGDPLNPCPGPDSSGKHVGEEEEPDHVTATLPNGIEVDFYGDAAAMAKEPPDVNQSVLRAISELLHNPETPSGLFEAVAEFTTEQSNEAAEELFHSDAVLTKILQTVKPEDRMSAVIARKEAAHAAN